MATKANAAVARHTRTLLAAAEYHDLQVNDLLYGERLEPQDTLLLRVRRHRSFARAIRKAAQHPALRQRG
jgi:hypothetical protein